MSVSTTLRAISPSERRLVIARLFARIGFDSCYFVGIIGAATYTLDADAFVVAALTLILNVTLAAGNGVAGVIIDRIGPRKTLIGSLVALSVCGVAIQFFETSVISLAIDSLVFGLAVGFMDTAFRAFPAFLDTDPEALKRANSLLETATDIAIIIGPAIGGLIVLSFPVRRVFVVLAIASLVAILIIRECHELVCPVSDKTARGEGDAAAAGGDFWGEFSEGLRLTFDSPELRLILAAGFLGFFAFGAFDSLESLFYRDVLRVGAEWMGWLSTIMGVGCLAGSLSLIRIPERRVGMPLLLLTLLVTGIGSMLYVGTSNVWCAAAGQLVTGLGFGLMQPLQSLLVQRDCPLSHLGRVMAAMRIGLQSAGILPLLVAPFLANAFGVQAVLFCASTCVTLVAVAFLARGRRGCRHA